MLCLYTDGARDNNTSFLATKLVLICLFLEENFETLMAVRTPLYHSWKNPVERIMSIINIAVQSVGLMQSPMPEELEKKLSGSNNVKQIREKCEGCPDLKDAVIDSMQPVRALLESLFIRLQLKQQPFEVFHAASLAEMKSSWSHILHIDGQLSREHRSDRILPQRPGF